jgi:hypothetical protein
MYGQYQKEVNLQHPDSNNHPEVSQHKQMALNFKATYIKQTQADNKIEENSKDKGENI